MATLMRHSSFIIVTSSFGGIPPSCLTSVSSVVPTILRRAPGEEDYTCGPDRECSNKACCGPVTPAETTKVYRYGELYCGDGCQSNCDATAECGRWQSNCNDPKCPSPAGGNVQRMVIGYYELWRANGGDDSACGIMTPEQIPVEYLDQVRISVGGCNFNDPGIFQSVFRRIAGNDANTLILTHNLMAFLFKHGFDGVDIDWEYPGADDWGGVPKDSWGISITVPTSYWYLRWFDIHTLETVVDEFNLMSYDLHGIWDRENPFGHMYMHIHAHTNLTEIYHVLDLFWRNGVHPHSPESCCTIDLANQYGLGGLGGLGIWAVDQDDKFFHALRAVTGKSVTPLPTSTDGWGAFDLDDCYITKCGDSCKAGVMLMTNLNQDDTRRGCEGDDHTARSCTLPLSCSPINGGEMLCCKAHSATDPETHGQCEVGEVTIVMDDYGDSAKRCTNGGRKASMSLFSTQPGFDQ
ncbi:glycoside hydrolase superfamily [Aspergillus keveii]|uniref:chitinase n=1 Tax=Aspergillus keveii TaxID=714993 RepID=A0ABR4FP39_9EURO